MTSTTDPLGRTTTFEYDAKGNLLQMTNPAGGTVVQTFDEQGRLASRQDPNGNVTLLEYAGLCCGNPSRVTGPTGETARMEYGTLGELRRHTDEAGVVTEYDHDGAGRLRVARDALGGETRYEWEGRNLRRVTDPLGRVTTYEYDARGNRTRRTDPEGGVTRLTYDGNDNLLTVTDPVGNVTRYVYDTEDRVVERVDPRGSSTSYAYDAAGNVVETVDRTGRKRTYAYDALNRLTSETWWDGGSEVRRFDYTYDAAGRMLSAAGPDSAYEFTHDPDLDRLLSVTNAGTPGVPEVTLTYEYDAKGNVTSMRDDLGFEVASSYDPRNLLATRSWSGPGMETLQLDMAYDARGQRVGIDRYWVSGPTTSLSGSSSFAYDELQRLTGVRHADPRDVATADYVYGFDAASQPVSVDHHGESFGYGYDAAGQLLSAERSVGADESYAYDANGNRTASWLHGTDYVTGDGNRLLSDGVYDYAYDAEGNMITRTHAASGHTTTYTWDHRNRLTRVEQRDGGGDGTLLGEVEYVYDVLDRRIARTAPGETTFTVYAGEHAWADFDGGGEVAARYLFGDRIDEILARYRPDEGVAWYLTDHLGTVRDIASLQGETLAHVDYTSFGAPQVSGPDPDAVDRYLFTGREYDAATGLYHYRARWYDPAVGRFLGEDPIGFEGRDANLYRYVANSPSSHTDPSGRTLVQFLAVVSVALTVFQTVYLSEYCGLTGEETVQAFFLLLGWNLGFPLSPALITVLWLNILIRVMAFTPLAIPEVPGGCEALHWALENLPSPFPD